MSTMIEEFAERLKNGQVNGKSEFNVRDDNARTKVRVPKISRSELRLGKTAKILIAKEAAFPFNPVTGLPDDEYNEKVKFRPMLSVSTVLSGMKVAAHTNPELKAAILEGTGIKPEEWDTSKPLSHADDYAAFRKYIGPRYFTLNVIRVNDSRVTGNEFGKDYRINLKRNELGELIGEEPLILKIHKAYRDLRQAEIQDVNEHRKDLREGREPRKLKRMREDIPYAGIGKMKDEDYKQKVQSEIRKDIPVTDDRPSNTLIGIELELNSDSQLVEGSKIMNYGMDDMNRSLRMYRASGEFEKGINLYLTGTLKNRDLYWDFYEIEMECPVEIANPSGNEKRDLGRETRYTKPTTYLADMDKDIPGIKDKVVELFSKFQDSDEGFEKRFMVSSYTSVLDDSVTDMLLEVMRQDKIMNDPYMSTNIFKYNEEVLALAYGEEFEKIAVGLDLGYVPKGMSEEDIDRLEAASETKKLDFEAMMEDGLEEDADLEAEAERVMPEESGAVAGTEANTGNEDDTLEID